MRDCVTHHYACDCRERKFAELAAATQDLLDEYDDRAAQFGDDYLWRKHEDKDIIEAARTLLREWRNAHGEGRREATSSGSATASRR